MGPIPPAFNPSNAESTFILKLLKGCKDFWKSSKPSHVGIHWIALAEFCKMINLVPVFVLLQEFFCIILFAKIATSSIRVNFKH